MIKIFKNNIRVALLFISVQTFLILPSLKAENEINDSASYYIKIAKENWHKDLNISIAAASRAFKLLPKVSDPALLADIYAQYGVSFYSRLEYDSAIYYYKKAYNLIKDTDHNNSRYVSYLCSALEKKGHYKTIFDITNTELSTKKINKEEYFSLLLIKLSAAIKIGFTEEAFSIIKQAEEIIPRAKEKYELYTFTKLKGKYYQLTASFKKSDSIFNELIKHYDSTNNKIDKAEALLFLAQNAMEISKYQESYAYLNESKAIYDSLNYSFGIAKIHLYTGTLLSWMQRYNESSDFIFKALEVFEKNKNLNEIQIAYYELGWIFYSLELEARAKKYLNQSLGIAREIQNIQYLGNGFNALGSLYTDLEKYDSAILYFDSSIYYLKINKNIKALAAAKFNKAVVLEKLQRNQEALKLYRESYKVDLKLNNYAGLIESEFILGNYFLKNNQLDSAEYYFNLGERRALELGEKYFLLQIYEAKANLNSKKDNHLVSAEYLQKALIAQKKLSEETKTFEIASLETTYDLKNKEKELAFLNLQKDNNEKTIALNQKTIESQRSTLILLAFVLIFLLILSYVIFRFLKIRTKTNQQLRELNNEIQEKQEEIMAQSEELKESNDIVNELNQFLEEKVKERTLALEEALSELDHFFYRASHDFRGPLTTLMGLVGVSKSYNLSDEANNLFHQVNITAKKLDQMVKKLQAVSFLGDIENLESAQKIELTTEINRIATDVIKNKSFDNINYNCDIKIETSNESVVFYPLILEMCLSNLIENSIVFNNSKEIKIYIKAVVTNTQLIISINDNGIGISEDQQGNIFNMFQRTSQTSTGNGLGLYVVKKAIELLNGQIQFKSETRKGSTFKLIFPLSRTEGSLNKEMSKPLLVESSKQF